MQEHAGHLDRFAEPHIIGQAGAETSLYQEVHPGDAALLVRPELANEAAWLRHIRDVAVSLEESVEPSLGLDRLDGQIAVELAGSGGERQGLRERQRVLAVFFPEV